MSKKKNKRSNKKPHKLLALLGVILILTITALVFTKSDLIKNSEKNAEVKYADMSTYTNADYGFEITYPTEGQVINSDGKMTPGKCGAAIKPTPISSYNYALSFDNYFMVTEQNFDGSIAEFINSYPGSNLFVTKPIDVPGANEAVSITKTADASPEDLMKSPFAYSLRIIKKGDEMFMIMGLQNDGNTNGCVPANNSERNKVIDTFRFTK